jgi:uncharacterized protein YndB with AHSA1/START domain
MPDIRHELIIGAPPEKVYEAITGQQGLAGWWTPEATAKAEIGSVARFPFGPDYFKEMKVTELTPAEKVTWNCISGATEWVGTTISFNLLPGDKKTFSTSRPEVSDQLGQQNGDGALTLLVFHHDNWKAYTPMYAECNYTWGRFLRGLKLFCETGKGLAWPDQHRTDR